MKPIGKRIMAYGEKIASAPVSMGITMLRAFFSSLGLAFYIVGLIVRIMELIFYNLYVLAKKTKNAFCGTALTLFNIDSFDNF